MVNEEEDEEAKRKRLAVVPYRLNHPGVFHHILTQDPSSLLNHIFSLESALEQLQVENRYLECENRKLRTFLRFQSCAGVRPRQGGGGGGGGGGANRPKWHSGSQPLPSLTRPQFQGTSTGGGGGGGVGFGRNEDIIQSFPGQTDVNGGSEADGGGPETAGVATSRATTSLVSVFAPTIHDNPELPPSQNTSSAVLTPAVVTKQNSLAILPPQALPEPCFTSVVPEESVVILRSATTLHAQNYSVSSEDVSVAVISDGQNGTGRLGPSLSSPKNVASIQSTTNFAVEEIRNEGMPSTSRKVEPEGNVDPPSLAGTRSSKSTTKSTTLHSCQSEEGTTTSNECSHYESLSNAQVGRGASASSGHLMTFQLAANHHPPQFMRVGGGWRAWNPTDPFNAIHSDGALASSRKAHLVEEYHQQHHPPRTSSHTCQEQRASLLALLHRPQHQPQNLDFSLLRSNNNNNNHHHYQNPANIMMRRYDEERHDEVSIVVEEIRRSHSTSNDSLHVNVNPDELNNNDDLDDEGIIIDVGDEEVMTADQSTASSSTSTESADGRGDAESASSSSTSSAETEVTTTDNTNARESSDQVPQASGSHPNDGGLNLGGKYGNLAALLRPRPPSGHRYVISSNEMSSRRRNENRLPSWVPTYAQRIECILHQFMSEMEENEDLQPVEIGPTLDYLYVRIKGNPPTRILELDDSNSDSEDSCIRSIHNSYAKKKKSCLKVISREGNVGESRPKNLSWSQNVYVANIPLSNTEYDDYDNNKTRSCPGIYYMGEFAISPCNGTDLPTLTKRKHGRRRVFRVVTKVCHCLRCADSPPPSYVESTTVIHDNFQSKKNKQRGLLNTQSTTQLQPCF